MLRRPALQHDIRDNCSTSQLLERLPTYCMSHCVPVIVSWRAFANATYLWHVYLIKEHLKEKEARGTLARNLQSRISQDIPVKPEHVFSSDPAIPHLCSTAKRQREEIRKSSVVITQWLEFCGRHTQSFCGGRLFFYGALMSLWGGKKERSLLYTNSQLQVAE